MKCIELCHKKPYLIGMFYPSLFFHLALYFLALLLLLLSFKSLFTLEWIYYVTFLLPLAFALLHFLSIPLSIWILYWPPFFPGSSTSFFLVPFLPCLFLFFLFVLFYNLCVCFYSGLGFSTQITDSIPVTESDMYLDKVLFCEQDQSKV